MYCSRARPYKDAAPARSGLDGIFDGEELLVVGSSGTVRAWGNWALKITGETSSKHQGIGMLSESIVLRMLRRVARRKGHLGDAWRDFLTLINLLKL